MNWFKYASPASFYPVAGRLSTWFAWTAGVLTAVGLYIGFAVAPTDFQQGESYRIIFVHVPAVLFLGSRVGLYESKRPPQSRFWRRVGTVVVRWPAPVFVASLFVVLIAQLVELMPELEEVSAWHSVGQRRTQEEMGRIVERTIPDSFFGDANY